MNTRPDPRPLCVDLDGTLIKSDSLIELFFVLLQQQPFTALLAPIWLLGGKAYLKDQIARRANLNPALLPYNEPFLAYLREEHGYGRPLVLATAANYRIAQAIAEHLGLFSAVFASDSKHNLSGARKRDALLTAYGEKGFDYAANGNPDLAIWPHAKQAILVNAARGLRDKLSSDIAVAKVFSEPGAGFRDYLYAIRVHQWLKNLLVFLPLFFSHQWDNSEIVFQSGLAFIAFSLCSSSVYLLNDLLDLPADRQHPRKSKRPLAAGTIPLIQATLMIPVLLIGAVAVATLLPLNFLLTLGFYYLLTLAYSLYLKQAVMVDVLLLAGLYTLRIIAGAAAITIMPSFWLLAFSMFLFLSLAMIKRYSELLLAQEAGKTRAGGRGYQVSDLSILSSLGGASGYMAVLVLALYINSEDVRALYSHPEMLWFICPVLLYWISRMWMAAGRGKLLDDPIVHSIKDRVGMLLIVIGVVIVILAA